MLDTALSLICVVYRLAIDSRLLFCRDQIPRCGPRLGPTKLSLLGERQAGSETGVERRQALFGQWRAAVKQDSCHGMSMAT